MIIRIKKKENPYVLLDKTFINDDRLKLSDKGLMTYLLAKPDDWQVQVKEIINHHPEGRDAILATIKRLRNYKYMKKTIVRDPETGLIKKHDYIVYECPQPENPEVDHPQTGFPEGDNPEGENPTLNNKGLNQINESTNTKVKMLNNNSNNGKPREVIIIKPKNKKRKFNKYAKKIYELGWVGDLNEVVEYWDNDPDFVIGWVDRVWEIAQQRPGSWGGLLRKNLRSGIPVPTQSDLEKSDRQKYLEDEFAEYIE